MIQKRGLFEPTLMFLLLSVIPGTQMLLDKKQTVYRTVYGGGTQGLPTVSHLKLKVHLWFCL